MFNSIHSQRWLKWVCQPKKYLVNIEVKIGDKYTFKDVEVFAYTKNEAKKKAVTQTKSEIQVITKGLRSFGRAKKFNEF